MGQTVRFGAFELDLAQPELRKHGVRLRLQEQPFQVLRALLEQPGEVVTREDLIRRLWPDGTSVDFDRGINAAVTRLRQVLSDSAETPRYIETIPRRGYRFWAKVEMTGASAVKPPQLPAKRRWWLALAGLGVAGILAFSFFPVKVELETRLEQLTRDPGLATDPAYSPDGKLLAYASDRGSQNLNILVKQMVQGGQAIQLTHGNADSHQPSFSPDGSRIAYRSERNGGGIYVIPTIGGEPARIAAGGRDPVFSPDGKWIAYWVGGIAGAAPESNAAGSVFVVPSQGGEGRRIGWNLPRGGFPIWSPDSTRLLVFGNERHRTSASDADWWWSQSAAAPLVRPALLTLCASRDSCFDFPQVFRVPPPGSIEM